MNAAEQLMRSIIQDRNSRLSENEYNRLKSAYKERAMTDTNPDARASSQFAYECM